MHYTFEDTKAFLVKKALKGYLISYFIFIPVAIAWIAIYTTLKVIANDFVVTADNPSPFNLNWFYLLFLMSVAFFAMFGVFSLNLINLKNILAIINKDYLLENHKKLNWKVVFRFWILLTYLKKISQSIKPYAKNRIKSSYLIITKTSIAAFAAFLVILQVATFFWEEIATPFEFFNKNQNIVTFIGLTTLNVLAGLVSFFIMIIAFIAFLVALMRDFDANKANIYNPELVNSKKVIWQKNLFPWFLSKACLGSLTANLQPAR